MSTVHDAWAGVMMNNYGTPPLALVSGKGAKVTAEDGQELIDMLAGIAVNSLGHAHPAVVEAISTQAQRLGHVSNLFASEPGITLATRLGERFAPGDDTVRVFFCNSGAEANEAAFKLARLTGKKRVLAAHHGFHGRTMGSLALTGQPSKRKDFEPLPSGVEFYPFGDAAYLRTLIEMNPADTAAIILEPIQGETGVVPAPDGFLKQVRELCDEFDLLMIVDEVQTGVARTGEFYAHQHEGVLPDVVTMAKGLGAGMPIGACLARGKAAQLFGPGSHGTTFGGNPVVCAAANAVLDVITDGFQDSVRAKGELLAEEAKKIPGVVDVRGRGLMLGLVLAENIAAKVVAQGLKEGVILNAPAPNVLRLTPPLIISEDEIHEAIARIRTALERTTA